MISILLEDGRKQWYCQVNGASVTYEHGIEGGKMQSETIPYLVGKNIGRTNETSPAQQCLMDAIVKVRKKIEKGYKVKEDLGFNIDMDTVTSSDLDVPKPMLAQDLHDHMSKLDIPGTVYYQPKLDGNRALVDLYTGKMYSRSRKEITHLPQIGAAVQFAFAKAMKTDKGLRWVDGELYAHGMSFNNIQTLIRRASGDTKVKPGSAIDTPEKFNELKRKLKFYAFDVIVDKGFQERMEYLDMAFGNECVEVVLTVMGGRDSLEYWHEKFVELGYEGVMVRMPMVPYEQKRSMSLFKYKAFIDEEFEVVGFESEKHWPDRLGAIVLYDEVSGEKFNARPAMCDMGVSEIWNNQTSYLNKRGTVKFQMRDETTKVPRFPVFMRFREEW